MISNIQLKSLMYKSYFFNRCKDIEVTMKCNRRIYTSMCIHTSLHFYTLDTAYFIYL